MALNQIQQSSRLFKKSMGAGETSTTREFFEEPLKGRLAVFADQLWLESALIPMTAPSLSNGGFSGVVQYYQDLPLLSVSGVNNSFYHANLKDVIPFNYGDGSYNYTLRDNSNSIIPFGQGDWVVDTTAGVLTFYSSVPNNMPPKITFYKYIGAKGVVDTLTSSQVINASSVPGSTTTTALNALWSSLGSSTGMPERKKEFFDVNSIIVSAKQIILNENPITDTELVYMNGLALTKDASKDYILSGKVITFNASLELTEGDLLTIQYLY